MFDSEIGVDKECHSLKLPQVVGNTAVSFHQCSYHLTGNANNNGTLPSFPHFHHDPTEIPEPSSNHNILHLDKAYDAAYFPFLEKF
jgi:hypothetical protein